MTGAQWDAAAVLAASAEWVWVPEGSEELTGEQFTVVTRPAYLRTDPSVRVTDPAADPERVVDEVLATMSDRGARALLWEVSDETRPVGLEAALMRRGGRVHTRLDVLGVPIAAGLPDLDVPADVVVREVTDLSTLRDSYVVSGSAFDNDTPSDEHLDWALRELQEGLPEGPVGRVVAYVDGRPAGTGGYTVVGPVGRLWGGSTHTELRGRGAYRAVLLERMRLARGLGATLALSHGSVTTSSPILRANGFVRYGEKREIVLDL